MTVLLDVVLLLVLLAYLVQGYRSGLVRSLGAIVGVVAGAVAAALLAPLIADLVPEDGGRVIATLVAAIVLVLLGHAVGSGVGALIGGVLRRGPLGPIDRVLGAAAGLVVSALAISVVASLAVALGVPYLAQPVASSAVLRVIDGTTPPAVDRALAQLRSTVLAGGIPRIGIDLGTGTGTGAVPAVDRSAALTAATASVVKITGRAPACRQEQAGSGFVVSPGRVLTNAHVVAGVTDPVVLTPDGDAVTGRVTAFDPARDLALIAVRGLDERPLRIAGEPQVGDVAVVAGYPFGGPYSEGGARVVQTGRVQVPDVGDEGGSSERSIAAIKADVEQGNSGGPLLTPEGRVAGVVFAKGTGTTDLGYAMTPAEFQTVVEGARARSARVSTGRCSRE